MGSRYLFGECVYENSYFVVANDYNGNGWGSNTLNIDIINNTTALDSITFPIYNPSGYSSNYCIPSSAFENSCLKFSWIHTII